MLTIHTFSLLYPSNLHSSITHLQNALQAISSWMSANLLTLNTSKTEFLLIGLKQPLAKINSCSLDTVHSVSNLRFIFDEHILLYLNPATHIFLRFDASVHILISEQPAPLLPLSFTLSLTTATTFQNSLARAVVRALKSSQLSPFLDLIAHQFFFCFALFVFFV